MNNIYIQNPQYDLNSDKNKTNQNNPNTNNQLRNNSNYIVVNDIKLFFKKMVINKFKKKNQNICLQLQELMENHQ